MNHSNTLNIEDPSSILLNIASELSEGVKNRNHAYHLLTVANISESGLPEARTVVHRASEFAHRKIYFHTDYRCQKVRDFSLNKSICLLFYNPENKMQLRIKAKVIVHHNNSISKEKWDKTRPRSKECYLQINPSGLEPELHDPKDYSNLEEGYKNFAVCECEFYEIDCLILHHVGHKRYKFTWDSLNNLVILPVAP